MRSMFRHLTVSEVYTRIMNTYNNQQDRPMYIHRSPSAYGSVGCVFFAIEGTPPKGYALYVPEMSFLIVIDAWGKSRKNENIVIDGIDEVGDLFDPRPEGGQ